MKKTIIKKRNKMGFFGSKNKVEDNLKKSILEILNTPVENIMSKYVISVQKNDALMHAADIIVGEKVSCVLVKDGEVPVAVLTERDFLKKAPLDKKKLTELNVSNLMSSKLITISPETTIDQAITMLVKNNFRKLVVAKNREIVGIVTQTDFVRLFDKFFETLTIKTSDLLLIDKIMTKNIEKINEGATFSEAKNQMANKNIGSIIIMKEDLLLGIITEYDVVDQIVYDTEKCNSKKVEDIMISPVMVVNKDLNIFDANRIMIMDNVRRLPVAEENKLLGIITQTDICRSIFYFLKATLWHLEKGDLKIEKLEKKVVEKRLL